MDILMTIIKILLMVFGITIILTMLWTIAFIVFTIYIHIKDAEDENLIQEDRTNAN